MTKTYTLSTVLAELDRQVTKAGDVSKWSRQEGVSPSYAHEVIKRTRPVGPKILRALGYAQAETL